jgi:hypothetical protein
MKRLLDEHIRVYGQVPEELVVVLDSPPMREPETVVAQGAHLHTSASPPGMLERLELAEIWRPCTVKEIKAPLRRATA